MGMFDTVTLGEEVELPYFPDSLDETSIKWQTKDFVPSALDKYKITNEGRLLREKKIRREKTDEEKREEARELGFDTWSDYREWCDKMRRKEDPTKLIDRVGDPLAPREKKIDEKKWVDEEMHGSFEFHGTVERENDSDIFLSYEARFTDGELDDIILLGERHGGGKEETIEKLES